jgi:hypothetical protein
MVINYLKKEGWTEAEAAAYVNEIGQGIEGFDEVKISELPSGTFAKLDYWFLRHNYFVWRCYHYIYYWNR